MTKDTSGEYYHIFNRGVRKQPIFLNDSDRFRFIFLVLVLQGAATVKNITRVVKRSVQSRTLHIESDLVQEIIKERNVELVCFCLMQNHFHLILHEKTQGAIAKYMQRLLTAYTKYFNLRHEKSGHLFQGSYKSVFVFDDEQLMYLSAYIHKNPTELKEWKHKPQAYFWSSYTDYIMENRWKKLLVPDIILERFQEKTRYTYQQFVDSSTAKEYFEQLNMSNKQQ